MNRIPANVRAKVVIHEGEGCWVWIGGKDWDGYGMTWAFKRQWRAPRLFFTLFRHEIPPGKSVLHTCDNPACVNPAHLYLGTAKDNMRDCLQRKRHDPPKGERNGGGGKLTESDVQMIRETYRFRGKHGTSGASLAARFNVCRATISEIVNKKKWQL